MRLLTATCFAALTSAAAALAAPAGAPSPRPYVLQSTARPPESRLLVHDALEEFKIQVDLATVAANPATLTIELPDSRLLEAVRTHFVVYRPDWKSWSGTLRYLGSKEPGTGYINFGVHGEQLTALIDFEGKRYRIMPAADGKEQRLFHLSDDLSPPSCGMISNREEGSPRPLFDGQEPAAAGASLAAKTGATSTRIDLLVVYPRAFFTQDASVESSILTFAQQSIQTANDVFYNSQVDAYYNLVGVVPIIGAQPDPPPNHGIFSSLAWMSTTGANGGAATEVAALRDAFRADVVTMFIPWEWNGDQDACGAANLPVAGGGFLTGGGQLVTNPPFGDRAFSALRNGCGLGDFTLAHEIGHNYGMRHHDDFAPNELFSYGHGYIFPPNNPTNATVMGCVCTGCFCFPVNDPRHCSLSPAAVCNRIPYFSDPDRTVNNQVIGTTSNNNTAVARAQVGSYSVFRDPSPNTPPLPNFTGSCPNMTCTFNGSGSYDYQTWVSTWSWDFGDGSPIQTGYMVSHPYTNAGTYRVHLIVTDSQGQTAVASSTASPHVPIYEGYHEVANCRSISGWAWDQVTPNTPINVDLYSDWSLAATVPANLCRSDLYWAGKGNGCHAFVFTPPWWWEDGQWHSITARYGGTGTNLSWSPISIICGASMFPYAPLQYPNLSTGGQVYTVATQFRSSVSGYISQLGFYRAPSESGANTLRLWTDDGIPLASVTTYCSGGGWCWGDISDVAISAYTLYRVSVNTNYGQAKTDCGIGGGITNQNLTAVQGFWQAGDQFPTIGSCSNFFVDVKFDL